MHRTAQFVENCHARVDPCGLIIAIPDPLVRIGSMPEKEFNGVELLRLVDSIAGEELVESMLAETVALVLDRVLLNAHMVFFQQALHNGVLRLMK